MDQKRIIRQKWMAEEEGQKTVGKGKKQEQTFALWLSEASKL
jgi:hypothetical protein